MTKSSFIVSFALLGIISLVVWGCGGWFGRKNNKQQQHAKTANAQQNSVATAPSSTSPPVFTDEVSGDTTLSSEIMEQPAIKWPPTDTPSILRSNSPIREKCQVGGYYDSGWRLAGGPKTPMPPDVFMDQYLLPYVNSDINELRLWQKRERNKDGTEYWHYTQYHKGLPTTHSLTLMIKNGMTLGFNTSFDETMDMDIVPTISEAQAWDTVKAFLAITDTKVDWIKKYRGILDDHSIHEFPYPKAIIDKMTYKVELVIESNSQDAPKKRRGNFLAYKFKLNCNNCYFYEPTLLIDPFWGNVSAYGSVNY